MIESEGKTQGGFVIELKYPLEWFAVFVSLLGKGHEDGREEEAILLELGNGEGAEEELWVLIRGEEEEEEEVCSIF